MGWNDTGYSDRQAERAAASGYSPRPGGERQMVNGHVSSAMHKAVITYAEKNGETVTAVTKRMGLGSSTWRRMRDACPIAQTTVLKIVTYLGTDLRSVLTKYQQKGGK